MRTEPLAKARQVLAGASSVAFLTGAGISTAAGIPDFRGRDGVWTRNPAAEAASTLSRYLEDVSVREFAWQLRSAEGLWQAGPTPAHLAIARLEQQGRLAGVVTQNTDGLHQLAGNDQRLVHEVHGNARRTRCERCGHEQPTWDVVVRVREGESDPRCQRPAGTGTSGASTCGGILRATTILFEEMLVRTVLDAAVQAVEQAEVLVTVGTLLSVQPVAGLVPLAIAHGHRVIIANWDETPYDDLANAVLRGDVQDTLPALLG